MQGIRFQMVGEVGRLQEAANVLVGGSTWATKQRTLRDTRLALIAMDHFQSAHGLLLVPRKLEIQGIRKFHLDRSTLLWEVSPLEEEHGFTVEGGDGITGRMVVFASTMLPSRL
jgi:hypothetical protein